MAYALSRSPVSDTEIGVNLRQANEGLARRAQQARLAVLYTIDQGQDHETSGITKHRRRGRGVRSNDSGRYETEKRVAFDDGWDTPETLPSLKTEVTIERAKRII